MRKNQRPNQVNDLWYIPVVPTGKPDFGVQTLRYYHRYMTEHPDAARLFPSKTTMQEEAWCSLYLLLDLHHYSGFSCHPSE